MAETPDGARIPPLPIKEWPPEMRDALAALTPPKPRHPLPKRRDDRPKALNLLGTFAHYPELVHAYHTFNGHVLFATSLSERQRELLVLRVAHVRGCEYEWRQHVFMADDVGLSRVDVERISAGPDAPGWEPLDQALLQAVDDLLTDARIAGSTWTVLAAELDTQQLFDVVFTVGAYDLLAMAMRSFDIQVDDDLRF